MGNCQLPETGSSMMTIAAAALFVVGAGVLAVRRGRPRRVAAMMAVRLAIGIAALSWAGPAGASSDCVSPATAPTSASAPIPPALANGPAPTSSGSAAPSTTAGQPDGVSGGTAGAGGAGGPGGNGGRGGHGSAIGPG